MAYFSILCYWYTSPPHTHFYPTFNLLICQRILVLECFDNHLITSSHVQMWKLGPIVQLRSYNQSRDPDSWYCVWDFLTSHNSTLCQSFGWFRNSTPSHTCLEICKHGSHMNGCPTTCRARIQTQLSFALTLFSMTLLGDRDDPRRTSTPQSMFLIVSRIAQPLTAPLGYNFLFFSFCFSNRKTKVCPTS